MKNRMVHINFKALILTFLTLLLLLYILWFYLKGMIPFKQCSNNIRQNMIQHKNLENDFIDKVKKVILHLDLSLNSKISLMHRTQISLPQECIGYNTFLWDTFWPFEMNTYFSDDELIEFYINDAPFGNNTFGFENAYKFYFEKEPSNINSDEILSLLAISMCSECKGQKGYRLKCNTCYSDKRIGEFIYLKSDLERIFFRKK